MVSKKLINRTIKRLMFGGKSWHFSQELTVTIGNTISLLWSHWWPISFKCYIWFTSRCTRIVCNIIRGTNFCLNVSICFSCHYFGWHEFSNIDKCVSIYFICLFAALFFCLCISFCDFVLYPTITFIENVRKKFK